MGKEKLNQRNISFLKSDTPLVSKRVRIILSSTEDSTKLADAVREQRKNSSDRIKNVGTFSVSDQVDRQLEAAG